MIVDSGALPLPAPLALHAVKRPATATRPISAKKPDLFRSMALYLFLQKICDIYHIL
jgi:hypothetical protein